MGLLTKPAEVICSSLRSVSCSAISTALRMICGAVKTSIPWRASTIFSTSPLYTIGMNLSNEKRSGGGVSAEAGAAEQRQARWQSSAQLHSERRERAHLTVISTPRASESAMSSSAVTLA